MLGATFSAPPFATSKGLDDADIGGQADAADADAGNVKGCIGLHNKSAAGGVVAVVYTGKPNADVGTFYLAAGQSLFCSRIRNVQATTTALADAAIEVLFG